MRKSSSIAALVLLLAWPCMPTVAEETSFSDDFARLQSRVKSMSHGYYSDKEWADVLGALDALAAQAREAGRTPDVLEVVLLQAMTYGDARREYEEARKILEEARKTYGDQPLPGVRRVYARLAETYARLGDPERVDALIAEFKKSPAYDGEAYPFAGGSGPTDPVTLVRPASPGQGSTTVTAMQGRRPLAELAPGARFPEINAMDREGRAVKMSDYRGRVVLVDFWVRNWHTWEQQLPRLVDTHRRYNPDGFEIVGICLDRDTSGLDEYLRSHGVTWRQVVGDPTVASGLGIYGEATSFLVDGRGVILGRDLTGSELLQKIKSAL